MKCTFASPVGAHRRLCLAFTLALVAAAAVVHVSAGQQQLIGGTNVNVVGGPACSTATDPNCPFKIYGDVSVQRQNEGSMACSSRNPLTCLASANDYRLINVPGVQDGKVTADAWLGLYWTRTGGSAWRSTLLPGWTTSDPGFADTTPDGLNSPIHGFQAAADPTVRAGTHGLFYISGIAFNRDDETDNAAPLSGGEGKSGVQFVSVYVDDNNTSNPDVPPRYIRTTLVDSGTSGRFLDKPWIAVDKPRGTATCTIPAGPNGVPAAQTVQSGSIYVAWATFLGSGNNPHSDIWVKSSTNCGASWSSPTKVTETVPLSQSPILAINPTTGDVHVVWREFGLSGSPDRILTAKSTNGAKSFTKAIEIANLGVPAPLSTAYDAFTLPNATTTDQRMARSNDYPGFCIGTDSVLRVVFSKRIPQVDPKQFPNAIQYSRIVQATSTNGTSWTTPQPVDNYLGAGHQFQPSIACTGPRATVMWYDERNDNAFTLGPLQFVFSLFIIDPIVPPPVHTIDVRAAQTPANSTAFEPSIQVSRYPIVFDTATQQLEQLQYFPLNMALFGGGTVPFIGDYIEVAARNPFTPPVGTGGSWTFNDYTDESPILHGIWTDNRDVLETNDWTNFGAPGTSACTAGTLTTTRNQNLYTALLVRGLVMQADGNARRSPNLERRAYAIFAHNLTPPDPGGDGLFGTADDVNRKRIKLSFAAGSGPASFDFNSQVNEIVVDIPAFSGAAKTVFIPKTSSQGVIVLGTEVDASNTPIPNGVRSRVVIAPDPNAPLDPVSAETHDLSLDPLLFDNGSGALVNSTTYANPAFGLGTLLNSPTVLSNVLNPGFVSPGFVSPGFVSPGFVSPGFVSPGFVSTFISPGFVSPGFVSPGFVSPGFVSPGFVSEPVTTDAYYSVQNDGSVSTAYNLNAIIDQLPAGSLFQVLVSKLYSTPGSTDCTPRQTTTLQTVANVTGTDAASASFTLGPQEQAMITFRTVCTPTAPGQGCFDPQQNLSAIVQSQAPDCSATGCDTLPDARKRIIDNAPPVITVSPGGPISVQGTGTEGASVSYAVTAADSVDALLQIPVTVSCSIDGQSIPSSGTRVFPFGTTTVTCTSTDSHGNVGTKSFDVTVVDTLPPVVTVPANAALEATSAAGASFTYSASATDNVDGAVTTTCSLPPGTTAFPVTGTFPVGASTVQCTATDRAGNIGIASFTVTVTDTMAPVLTLPPNIAVAGETGATVTFSATAVDVVDGSVPVTCTPASGSFFPLGTTTVQCSATDRQGNTASGGFTVTVQQAYGFSGLLSPYQAPPKTYNNGSSVPMVWQWTLGGVVVNSSAAQPQVTFVQLLNASSKCVGGVESTNPNDIFVDSATPGNSDFQYSASANTWQLNWKSPARPGACFDIYIGSLQTGQKNLAGRLLLK